MTQPLLLLLLCISLFFQCSTPPTGPDTQNGSCSQYLQPDAPPAPLPPPTTDRYIITFPDTPAISPQFSYTVLSGTDFLLPFHYFDNPVDSFTGPLISSILVSDINGNSCQFTTETVTIGPVPATLLHLQEPATFPVTFSYSVDFSVIRKKNNGLDLPTMFYSDTASFFTGTYCLMIPQFSHSLTALWRTPYTAEVVIRNEPETVIFGIPDHSFFCSTVYELLFLQFSHGAQIMTCGNGGGVDFVIMNGTDTSWSTMYADSINTLFSSILSQLSSQYTLFTYGSGGEKPYTLIIQDMDGALEGTYGFTAQHPIGAFSDRFTEILAHEALHHFIGIRCGDLDDPWWKEATTTYLAMETVMSLGYYDIELFRSMITTWFSESELPQFQRALSDPWLREHMFAELLHGLVYNRGAQLMMMLDENIRTGSDNRFTLHHPVADLCNRFNGSAFSREELIRTLEHYGATYVDTFFSTYIDRPDTVPSIETLTSAFNRLDSLAGW